MMANRQQTAAGTAARRTSNLNFKFNFSSISKLLYDDSVIWAQSRALARAGGRTPHTHTHTLAITLHSHSPPSEIRSRGGSDSEFLFGLPKAAGPWPQQ